ncbi:hypothetical protein LTR28_009719, partial [Elasticomyces elasticus]
MAEKKFGGAKMQDQNKMRNTNEKIVSLISPSLLQRWRRATRTTTKTPTPPHHLALAEPGRRGR